MTGKLPPQTDGHSHHLGQPGDSLTEDDLEFIRDSGAKLRAEIARLERRLADREARLSALLIAAIAVVDEDPGGMGGTEKCVSVLSLVIDDIERRP